MKQILALPCVWLLLCRLLHINVHKSSGPDGLPSWLLRDFAPYLLTYLQQQLYCFLQATAVQLTNLRKEWSQDWSSYFIFALQSNVYNNCLTTANTHTHPFNGPLSRTTWVQQETVSGSGISWAMCKSAPCFRQTTTPALKTRPLSFFTDRMPFMPPNQQRQSTEGNKHCKQHITYQTTTTVPPSFSSYIY